MKKHNLLVLILITINSFGQNVFTNAFGGEMPNSIQIVGDNLYVATFATQKLYKLDLNNPTNIETVSNFTIPLLKIDYDAANNDFYCNSLVSLSVVDLDQSLPAVPTFITNVSGNNGLVVHNNIIYVTDGQNIYTYDIALGTSSYQLFYTETDGIVRNPSIYNNELFYQVFNSSDPSNNGIYKIDISISNPSKVLVSSTNVEGVLQSSIIVNDYLYLGFESPNKISRIDLTNSNLPIIPTVIFDDLGAGVIGLANKDETIYYTTGQQIIYNFNESVLNINDFDLNNITIYPNPSENIIRFKGVDAVSENAFYSVYSSAGALIIKGNFHGSLDVSNLNRGMYFIELNEDGKRIYVTKIIKN